ncbi:hypothetical protein ACVR05_06970 [Streptococcus caprae]|uniref:TMhelix containing protein n=1 Tax=Streptococcus caprae TaxID=1640501 RepID=A0ABV8CW98_9STRE
MKKTLVLIQMIWFILSPIIALKLATMTSAVDNLFVVMVILLTVSQWLAVNCLGELRLLE